MQRFGTPGDWIKSRVDLVENGTSTYQRKYKCTYSQPPRLHYLQNAVLITRQVRFATVPVAECSYPSL